MPVAPYGSWRSPVTPQMLVEQAVGLSSLSLHAGSVYWVESRPSEQGRQVLVSAPVDGGPPVDVSPPGMSVRTQVHEYGGRCYAVGDGIVVFSNWADQRLWVHAGGSVVPVTPAPRIQRSHRYADPVMDPSGHWVICVRERHHDDGRVENDLVAVPLSPGSGDPEEPHVLAAGHDFYAAPRLSPDGGRLAWVTWDHPDMPWDATTLWSAEVTTGGGAPALRSARPVAGGPGESVTQPRWSPEGVLHYVSDRSGWWNIYDEAARPLWAADTEFADPDWVFGNQSYGFEPDGTLVATWRAPGGQQIGTLRRGAAGEGSALERVDLPYSSYAWVCPVAGGAFAVAASPLDAPAIVRLEWAGGPTLVVRASREVDLAPGSVSRPAPVEFATGDGDRAHALFYPPASADHSGPPDERPPVIVIIHGGPTSSTSAVFNLAVQFWTTRGIAVADVDYRGSSGYGRAYRRKLEGRWGVADVEDCAAVVADLDRRGWVDADRAAIRGGSAGGFTALAALAFTDVFCAGASLYGIGDLALLAAETHKFESRYTDSLVGPWPEMADDYRRRSPVHHIGHITCPLILFQGLEDRVVPPDQSRLMYEALASRGVPVAYLPFEGEQHGFRMASTIMRVAAAELEFYGRVLGFTPDLCADPPLEITNGEALSPRS